MVAIIVGMNVERVPGVIKLIFSEALNPSSVFGGIADQEICIRMGHFKAPSRARYSLTN